MPTNTVCCCTHKVSVAHPTSPASLKLQPELHPDVVEVQGGGGRSLFPCHSSGASSECRGSA